MERIISLDASTKTIGIAIFDEKDGKPDILHYEYFKPPKSENFIDDLLKTKQYIMNLAEKYNAQQLAIEEYIQYMKGKSGAKTVIPLAIFNRTICLSFYEKHNKMPVILNVLTVRHALKLSKDLPAKEDMPALVAHHLGWSEFPWIKEIKRRKLKTEKGFIKQEEVIEENFDMADGIAVGLAYFKVKDRPIKQKKKKSRKTKKVDKKSES